MKIIDLLNKIANGEDVPTIVKYNGFIYKYDKNICDYDGDDIYLFDNTDKLNNEVEILEEEPRDIEVCGSLFTKSEYDKLVHSEEEKKIPEKLTQFEAPFLKGDKPDIRFSLIIDQINEIIDYLDYLKSKGE